MFTGNPNRVSSGLSAPAFDAGASGRRILRYGVVVAAAWTAVVGLSAFWSINNEFQETEQLARIEARTHFNKDLAFRFWATRHGGVYVPTDQRTPPNPYLDKIAERDIQTPSGRLLTLMNPAYMVRQVMAEYSELYGVRGRITSLKPLRPENAPDPWETKALEAFERGAEEVFEYASIDGIPYLRLMRPMITQTGCLKCHEHQGYKVGDVRGGVGVAVPMAPYRVAERRAVTTLGITHGTIWLLGLGLIGAATHNIRRRSAEASIAEAESQRLSQRNQALLDAAGEGIYGVDGPGHTIFINPAACRMLGRDAEEIIGQDQHSLFHHTHADGRPYPSRDCPIFQTLADGQPRMSSGETFWRKDGTSFPVDLVVSPLPNNGGGAVVVFHDISERVRTRREQDRLLGELGRSNEELQQFAYAVSHDLQEPLRMVANFLQLLERRQTSLDAEGHEFIGYAVDGARRMSQMINDLLAFSRVQSKGAPLVPVEVDRALDEALANLRFAAEEAGAEIHHQPLPKVIGDIGQLTSLFQNLIGNAIKYRASDRPPHITIGAARRGEFWEFAVTDNGIGIGPEHFERIFMIFQRLHGRGAYPGTGIGLAICKKIVERHGGRISVESVPAKGSTFRFILPAVVDDMDGEIG